MSNVNDNNLDDLLRRAADKYPLRTDSADFNRLVADLDKDPSLILPPLNAEDRRRRRRFFWLFLLLPLAGGAYLAWHAGTRSDKPVQAAAQSKEAGNRGPAVAAGVDGKGAAGGTGKEVAEGTGKEKTGGDGKEVGGGNGTAAAGGREKEAIGENGKALAGGSGKVAAGANSKEVIGVNGKRMTGTDGQRVVGGNGKDVAGGKVKGITGVDGKEVADGNGKEIIGGSRKRAGGVAGSGKDLAGKVGGDGKQTDPGNATVIGRQTTSRDRSGVGGRLSLIPTRGAVGVNVPVTAKSDESSSIKKQASAKDKIKLQKPKHSFYVGIVGSPDLSVVKFQSVKSVGDNFGVLFGYTLNSRWSIETGLLYDRKKYYTNGEYFSKSKLPQPMQDIDLHKVEGGCNMWEIPLNVRYNFHSTNGKMQWFATAGFSTYLMSKEQYTFWGTYWGNPDWHKTYPYDTPYKYWFSILNLSAGFEQPLGKIGNLRIEPFVRVPLSGIGTGSLSIMSAGLNIGITRKIW